MVAHKILSTSLIAASIFSMAISKPATCQQSQSRVAPVTSGLHGTESAIRWQLNTLRNAVTRGDARAMANLFASDGIYIDEDGNEYHGRPNIQKAFESVFQDNQKPQVDIVVSRIIKQAPGITLAEGLVRRTEGGSAVDMTRYNMTFKRQQGQWLISTARERAIGKAAGKNPLEELSWLVGDWTTNRNGHQVQMKAEWAPSRNFITCKYTIKKPNLPALIETQVIGWDPRNQRPISWTFDSTGGFGQGNWSRQHNKWIVDASGIERDGTKVSSTNIYSHSDAASFSWQSVNRHVNGAPVADAAPLKIQRVAHHS